MGLTFTPPRQLRVEDGIEGFLCGVEVVDCWVTLRARKARSAGTAVVFATFCEGRLAGLYSLSSQSIPREGSSGWIARNVPDHIPVILLGMLGADQRYQGCGLGHDLLLDAVHRAQSVSEQIDARAIVADPADASARSFYALRVSRHPRVESHVREAALMRKRACREAGKGWLQARSTASRAMRRPFREDMQPL